MDCHTTSSEMAWFTHILNQPLTNGRKGARVAGCLCFTDEAIGTIYIATIQWHGGKMDEAISWKLTTIQHSQGNAHQVHMWHLSSWGWQLRETESDSSHGNKDLHLLSLEVTVVPRIFHHSFTLLLPDTSAIQSKQGLTAPHQQTLRRNMIMTVMVNYSKGKERFVWLLCPALDLS